MLSDDDWFERSQKKKTGWTGLVEFVSSFGHVFVFVITLINFDVDLHCLHY